jgi:FKBP-type peptidyl-prolyl cis-trans isomerase SlpA
VSQSIISAASKVTLHFAVKLADGKIVDTNFDKAPATFVFGDGNLLPGFERKLLGLSKGDSAEFTVLPEEAFGQPNPNNMQTFKRSVFAPDMDLHEGLVVSFADASKAELPGVIKHIGAENVTVDFNHPLAGHALIFAVQIIDVAAVDALSVDAAHNVVKV